ncbi:glycosyltransferase [Arthrobacter sp. I2-34]|uniref:4,4'-diaponeurosporenoate glycosyltransferase n=1 Tax=Arthrobacter hankyongi TaxID=2904801 RepID=A0ABS9LCJ2_9MICC|nr:glycosyltransferase family 2 protein [Arthrobacter hankyongi]MCG2624306.1 glycosyltransferase [Arthrobacter hankyongi]
MNPIDHVAVVVPARNEEAYLPRSLACLGRAVDELLRCASSRTASLTASVTVVLDGCTDGSAELLAGWPGVGILEIDEGNVGMARAAGVGRALARHRGRPGSLWLANTDADTMVPPHWLTAQLAYAATGIEMVLGTVMPDPDELSAAALDRWMRRHRLAVGHPHIHGANLGLNADLYLRAGGYRGQTVGEDRDLVARAKGLTSRWVAADDGRVVTSARTTGRAPDGFARYLALLPESSPRPVAAAPLDGFVHAG